MGSQYKGTSTAKQAVNISALLLTLNRSGTIAGMHSIGSRVKALRVTRHLSQVELAKRLKISQSAISQIERGTTKEISGEVLVGLCRALITTPDFIMFGAGTDEAFEAEMQIAEVAHIMHLLPDQAREALLTEARLVARATLPAGTNMDPFGKPAPKMPGDRRHVTIAVDLDRRKH